MGHAGGEALTTLIAIDPGQMSGVFIGKFDEVSQLRRLGYAQVPGGFAGIAEWFDSQIDAGFTWDVVVSEKFSTRPMSRQYKLEELEPIRIEGLIQWLRPDVVWQAPAMMVLRQGDTQAQRKRNSDDVLRRGGLWLTGKDVNYKDANDANAAAKHALAYMRSIKHAPTIAHYFQR